MSKKLFKDVIGYEEVKKELEKVCDMMKNPDKYKAFGCHLTKGIMLHGIPGVGKTLLATSFLKECKRRAFICRKNDSKEEFIESIRILFEEAAKEPSVILFDDMDKFGGEDSHNNDGKEVYSIIQQCMEEHKDDDIFVIATANNLRRIPRSLLRKGRFDISLCMEPPKGKEAEKIVAHFIKDKKLANDVNASELATILDGNSCAALEAVINEAGAEVAFSNRAVIEMKDIKKASQKIIFDMSNNIEKCDRDVAEKVACHEAGHAIVSELLSPESICFVTIGQTDGHINGCTKEEARFFGYSKSLIENKIKIGLAGKAAVEVKYGETDTGSMSDLAKATDLTKSIVTSLCEDGFSDYLLDETISERSTSRIEEKVAQKLSEYYRETKKMIIDNIDFLDAVTEELLEKTALTHAEIQEIKKSVA